MTFSRQHDKRKRIFKKSKPLVRQYRETDNGFLWAAYLNKSFDLPEGLDQRGFLNAISKKFGAFNLLWIIEDDNKQYRSGRGQIALVGIQTDGWSYVPKAHFFKWATPRNVLRAAVAFFHMMRSKPDVGVVRVEVLRKDVDLLKLMESYGVLYIRSRIPRGSPEGDLWVFSINGKKTGR